MAFGANWYRKTQNKLEIEFLGEHATDLYNFIYYATVILVWSNMPLTKVLGSQMLLLGPHDWEICVSSYF